MNLSLVIVALAAFATPMLLSRFKLSIIPTSVAEIIVGIILGQSCLNVIHINSLLSDLSTLGVILLLFLSGMEIDFSLFQRNREPRTPLEKKVARQQPKQLSPVLTAVIAYTLCVATSFALALIFKVTGLFGDIWLATILLATIALGLVISLLKENSLLSKPYGQTILLIAVLGEVVPMLALTVYAALYAGKGSSLWLISLLFIAGAILFRRFKSFFTFFDRINKPTTQVDMRLAFFVIITLVVIAEATGAENILGAFVAGIVVKLLEPKRETLHKLDSIGYGFFIPVFFILTGVKLNIPALLTSPKVLIMIAVIFGAFLLAKLPVYFGLRLRFNRTNSLMGAVLSETTITLILAALEVAQELHAITTAQSGAFLLAAILTCVVCPLLFNRGYHPAPEDNHKTTVHIIGVGLVTVAASQQLESDWYDTQLYTNIARNYSTYNSEANLTLLDSLEPADLIASQVFDTDVLVLCHGDSNVNYRLAVAAKEYGVKRVITRFESRDPLSTHEETLQRLGIEFYSMFDFNVGSLRSLITSPSTLKLITSPDARLYEVVVNNSIFDGMEIRYLPFINDITISRIFRVKRAIAPHGNTRLQLGDHIIFSGNPADVRGIKRLVEQD